MGSLTSCVRPRSGRCVAGLSPLRCAWRILAFGSSELAVTVGGKETHWCTTMAGSISQPHSFSKGGRRPPLDLPRECSKGGRPPLNPQQGLIVQPASATTKRAQVRGILEELIATELNPGDAIPSERALVIRLGVSRVTVRQAIADLVGAGVLERVHGKGTYLTGPQVDSRLHLTSFSREMRARGLIPATVVLSAAEQPADDDVSYALRIRPGQSVVRVERLRTADGTPMAYEVGHYPSALFPGLLQRELGSLYDVFAQRIRRRGEQR